MRILIRVVSNTDWKCRPDCTVTVLKYSDSHEDLLTRMNEEVEGVKQSDIRFDQESENEDAEEEGREPVQISTWENNEQWEMDLTPPEGNQMRTLVYKHSDGGTGYITYRVLEI